MPTRQAPESATTTPSPSTRRILTCRPRPGWWRCPRSPRHGSPDVVVLKLEQQSPRPLGGAAGR